MLEGPAEAARYALTRRLIPVLRHHMVVHLQPIGMIYEVLERRLSVVNPDLNAIREGLAKINSLARSAVVSCLDVVTWLSPDANTSIGVSDGVAECVSTVNSDFRFRGFTVTNECGDAPLRVSQAALREVFTAALVAVTDSAEEPVDLLLRLRLAGDQAVITVETRPGQATGFTSDIGYRALVWSDVVALAQLHQVILHREATLAVLSFVASPSSAVCGVASAVG